MTTTSEIKIHSIKEDGLPDTDKMVGRVAFIFDGCIVSGWSLDRADDDGGVLWEADSDVGHHRVFSGVSHWVEFEAPIWEIESRTGLLSSTPAPEDDQ